MAVQIQYIEKFSGHLATAPNLELSHFDLVAITDHKCFYYFTAFIGN